MASASDSGDDPTINTVDFDKLSAGVELKQMTLGKIYLPKLGDAASGTFDPSAELPVQARAASLIYSQTKDKSRRLGLNNLHHAEQWFYCGAWSDKWQDKRNKLFWYSSPPGVNHIKSTNDAFNVAWMAQSRAANYPKFGPRGRSVRMGALKSTIGPKADWETLVGSVKDVAKLIPAALETVGMAASVVATGGATAPLVAKPMVKGIKSTMVDSYEAVGGLVKGTKARTQAAKALVEALGWVYMARLKAANPHAVKNGKLDVSASYMKYPKTYADLSRPGDARPLLYNPARLSP